MNTIWYRFYSEKDSYEIHFNTTEMSIGDIKKEIIQRRNMYKFPENFDLLFYDEENSNLIKYFKECIEFIENSGKVFVHCLAGISRSPTIVIAYLMWTKKMSFDDALKFVQSKRFIVYPNPGFREQLQLFEKELIKNEYNIDKINFNEIQWTPKESYYDF